MPRKAPQFLAGPRAVRAAVHQRAKRSRKGALDLVLCVALDGPARALVFDGDEHGALLGGLLVGGVEGVGIRGVRDKVEKGRGPAAAA